jgi:hypothetical protein
MSTQFDLEVGTMTPSPSPSRSLGMGTVSRFGKKKNPGQKECKKSHEFASETPSSWNDQFFPLGGNIYIISWPTSIILLDIP